MSTLSFVYANLDRIFRLLRNVYASFRFHFGLRGSSCRSLDKFGNMSTSDSVSAAGTKTSAATLSATSPTTSNITTAAGVPGVLAGNGTCALNVEEDSSRFGKVVWTNCCLEQNPALNCPPQGHNYTSCPVGYLNCADPIGHAEMCLVVPEELVYSDARPLNKKCCPKYV